MKERILYFSDSGFGDNLFTVPALMELEERCDLHVAVPAGPVEALFQVLLPRARIWGIKPGWGGALEIAWKGFRFDYWLYSVGSSFRRTRLINLLGRAKKRYAFTSLASEKTWQLEIGFDVCLAPDLGQRAWRNNKRLVTLLDPSHLKNTKGWDDYAAEARRRVEKSLAQNGGEKSADLFIHAGCNKYVGNLERYKRWPLERYMAVAGGLLTKGRIHTVDFFTGPADGDLLPEFRTLAGKSSHKDRIADYGPDRHGNDLMRISGRLLKAKVFVGNDSGLAHLAALLGVPTVVVTSCIGQPAYTSPDGLLSRTVMHWVPCQGCTTGISAQRALKFSCPNEWACMTPITPSMVQEKIEDLLDRAPVPAGT